VTGHVELRAERVPDHALAVDHVRDAAGQEPRGLRHLERGAHLAADVRQQRERQLVLLLNFLCDASESLLMPITSAPASVKAV
jgi:hypothetical protein